jgi:glutathione S-transferase
MMKLYGHVNRKSPNSLKLRVALAEAGARYQYIPVDLAAGQQREPGFLALNPHGKIPLLLDEGFPLPESDAILWYIAERFSQARLLPPADGSLLATQERARVLQWCDFVSTGVYQAFVDLYIHTLQGAPDKRVSWIGAAAAEKMERLIGVMDGVLGGRSYLVGDFSIADIAAASVLQAVKSRCPRDPTAERAHIAAWYARVTARPSWQQAMQDAMQEAVEDAAAG